MSSVPAGSDSFITGTSIQCLVMMVLSQQHLVALVDDKNWALASVKFRNDNSKTSQVGAQSLVDPGRELWVLKHPLLSNLLLFFLTNEEARH